MPALMALPAHARSNKGMPTCGSPRFTLALTTRRVSRVRHEAARVTARREWLSTFSSSSCWSWLRLGGRAALQCARPSWVWQQLSGRQPVKCQATQVNSSQRPQQPRAPALTLTYADYRSNYSAPGCAAGAPLTALARRTQKPYTVGSAAAGCLGGDAPGEEP